MWLKQGIFRKLSFIFAAIIWQSFQEGATVVFLLQISLVLNKTKIQGEGGGLGNCNQLFLKKINAAKFHLILI